MELNTGGDLQHDINVTPLVDVVLVLLIIFMVIVPLTMRGYDVDIPGESSSATPVAEPESEQIVLAIDVDHCPVISPPAGDGLPGNCEVRVNDDLVSVTELPRRLAETFATRDGSDRVLFLSAQEQLNYEGVMRILDLARSEVEDLRIGFVTEK